MKKSLSLLLIICLLVWVSHAELVYDAATNSYVNSNTSVEETTTEVETTATSTTTSTADEGIVYDPETNSYINTNTTTDDVDDEIDSSTTTNTTDDSEAEEIPTDQISSISSDSASQTTTQTQITTSNNRNGTLEYMHKQIDSHHAWLHQLLEANFEALLSDSDSLSSNSNSRLSVLECLSILDNSSDWLTDIKETYDELINEITIITTDLHSEVSGLEAKIEWELLSQLNENLQVWSLQNKIDAYNAEYTNVVEMYYELSLDEVANADALIEESSSEYKQIVDLYDQRVALYKSLENEYTQFLEKSSIAWNVAWPNIQSLLDVMDTLEVYYMSQYNEKWENSILTHIPANNKAFIETIRDQSRTAFSAYFNAQADSLLYGLYPVEWLQNIDQWVLSIRSWYLHDNGTYDCKAFVENNNIDVLAPALESDMSNLLSNLNIAANNLVWNETLPSNADELADLLAQRIQENWFDDISTLVNQELQRIETKAKSEWISWIQYGVPSLKTKWKSTVREFLQHNYKRALEQDAVSSFSAKLSRAYNKVISALAQNPTGQTLDMLEAIQEVIEEFM